MSEWTDKAVTKLQQLANEGYSASQIAALIHNELGLTFSRNAADELRQRVAGICSEAAARQCTVATFHSFCLRVLRRHLPRHQHRYGYGEGFSVCTRDEQQEILSGCLDLWLAEPAGAREQQLAGRKTH